MHLSGERMTGTKVYVCSDASCSMCGTFNEPVGNGAWGVMRCGGDLGIHGQFVKVVSPKAYLQITEMEIYAFRKYLIDYSKQLKQS